METVKKTELDREWVALLLQAKKQGLSLEEIRSYLQKTYIPSNERIFKATSI
ncbi:anti-repressor SinI family protein [Fictibacillus sp. WQ 8-8]|uniref:anti-repressor SinI family protein n=1 Tax=unclassified Fictibacillus TaxID=2644029 RepID=UPI0021093BDE|nr:MULTISPECIES: anti-repressor SinI family protein [unclassified Fictibacillus]MCQ6268035.1 anti-repressor SinI family protein [Fictibacillus sp. WQ 8-8]MED2971267.1 anti-repressor SinI family protein [Fictibacillus sp. B-59209]UZJ80082.1 anti-repressor SinI family protein [Fictibacillus sp. KU28468]